MYKAYRDHKPNCPHKPEGRRWTRCDCPIRIENGRDQTARKTLDTKIWKEAQLHIAKLNTGAINPVIELGVSMSEALVRFEADLNGRKLRKSSIKKYKVLFGQLNTFCRDIGISKPQQFTLALTEKFRQTAWAGCTPGSANKRLERLRTLFGYLVSHGWMRENFAKILKAPKQTQRPTLPFTSDEVQKILDTCETFHAKHPIGREKSQRLRVLCLLMRYTGLRIGDAASLGVDRVSGGRLFLRTDKTGTMVYYPIPQPLINALEDCPRMSPKYYFWTGMGAKETVSENYRRIFRMMCTEAKITNAHPHRFRDTFAVEELKDGTEMAELSKLLGHSSIKITEKYYAPWESTRQARLEERVKRRATTDPILLKEQSRRQEGTKLVRVK